jgi:hypothetical protein
MGHVRTISLSGTRFGAVLVVFADLKRRILVFTLQVAAAAMPESEPMRNAANAFRRFHGGLAHIFLRTSTGARGGAYLQAVYRKDGAYSVIALELAFDTHVSIAHGPLPIRAYSFKIQRIL